MPQVIDQIFPTMYVSGEILDALLAHGWRRTSDYFFRMNISAHGEGTFTVLPLRIALNEFRLSKSQKRIWNKNADTTCRILPTTINDEKLLLFDKHKVRFGETAPESLSVYLSPSPGNFPCTNFEFDVYKSGRLIAVSFLDIGSESTSALYAMFDPEEEKRGLGIYTMLKEIEWSSNNNKNYYYPGYTYKEPSFYDYKKNFHGLQQFNWEKSKWIHFPKKGFSSIKN